MRKLNGTQTGDKISDRMQELGLSIQDLADALEITYEHMRRIAKGETVASAPLLKLICGKEILDLDYIEMEKTAKVDRIKGKYGELPESLTTKIPAMAPIERAWNRMSKQHQEALISMAKTFAKEDHGSVQ